MSDSHRQIALRFLQCAASGDVETAFALVTPDFRHHNPYFAGDAAALKAGMAQNARDNPDKLFEVQQVIADSDRVVVHSRVRMPAKSLTIAVVHLFRFEQDRIAELWDVGQMQPETMLNEHGLF